jgi:hypothetical protein
LYSAVSARSHSHSAINCQQPFVFSCSLPRANCIQLFTTKSYLYSAVHFQRPICIQLFTSKTHLHSAVSCQVPFVFSCSLPGAICIQLFISRSNLCSAVNSRSQLYSFVHCQEPFVFSCSLLEPFVFSCSLQGATFIQVFITRNHLYARGICIQLLKARRHLHSVVHCHVVFSC